MFIEHSLSKIVLKGWTTSQVITKPNGVQKQIRNGILYETDNILITVWEELLKIEIKKESTWHRFSIVNNKEFQGMKLTTTNASRINEIVDEKYSIGLPSM